MVGLFLDHIDHCSHVEEALPVRVGDGDHGRAGICTRLILNLTK